jgi:hypothetical protein
LQITHRYSYPASAASFESFTDLEIKALSKAMMKNKGLEDKEGDSDEDEEGRDTYKRGDGDTSDESDSSGYNDIIS